MLGSASMRSWYLVPGWKIKGSFFQENLAWLVKWSSVWIGKSITGNHQINDLAGKSSGHLSGQVGPLIVNWTICQVSQVVICLDR
jgi:hypothetical protein